MTGPRWSIWLTLEKEHEAFLSQIISELAEKYNAPEFRPHCTVYSTIQHDPMPVFCSICDELRKTQPFHGKISKVIFSNILWKTIFIELNQSAEFTLINSILDGVYTGFYPFIPHISLIYKKLSIKKKRDILSNLNPLKEYHFNAIEVVKTGTSVDKWKTVYRLGLG